MNANFISLILYNGKYYPDDAPVIRAQSPGFKWGYGIFETIRVLKGRIRLVDLHMERLFSGLKLLHLPSSGLEKERIPAHILDLCGQNACSDSARVRLALFSEGEEKTGWLMEAFSIPPETGRWKEQGLVIDIFPYARKSIDAYSNLKTASALPYRMALDYAKEKRLDDAILLNSEGHLCDSSIANIFIVKNDAVYTPALTQGCVNGVMRRFVMDTLKQNGYAVHQGILTEENLYEADEVFLTNSIRGMQWVEAFREKRYNFKMNLEMDRMIQEAFKP